MRGHVRKRASGRWAVVLDVGRDAETGRRIQKWRSGFATKKAAEAALAELLVQARSGDLAAPTREQFADYLDGWLRRRERLATLTREQYERVIASYVRPDPVGAVVLSDLTRAHVRAFEARLQDRGLSVSTRNVVMAVVSGGLADAVEDQRIPANPAAGKRRTSGQRAAPKFTAWTAGELRDLLAAGDGTRLEAAWRLLVDTGCRRGELLGLDWRNVSFASAEVTIARQAIPAQGGTMLVPPKTGRTRTVTINASTVRALERHRDAQLVEREQAADAYRDHDLVFADELGRPIEPRRFTAAFNALRAEAGIRPGRLHDVRHSVASAMLSAGVPIHVAAARLGHANPRTLLTTYAHSLPKDDHHAASVMASVLD